MNALRRPRRPWPKIALIAFALSVLALGSPTGAQSPTPAPTVPAPTPTPLSVRPWGTPTPTPVPSAPIPIEAPAYHDKLDSTIEELHSMEKASRRPLGTILQNWDKNWTVRREDGKSQTIEGNEFGRRATDAQFSTKKNATRDEVRVVRESFEARRAALDEWLRPDEQGRYFQGADAQTRIKQLEASGQIRTGPSEWEKRVEAFWKAVGDAIAKFGNWLASILPKGSPGAAPNIDPIWIKILFYGAAFALVAAICYLVFRAMGVHLERWRFFWRRPDKRRKVEFVGEDAELLELPPDELLDRARAYANAGNFREALRHAYIRLLLQLDAPWRLALRYAPY